MNFPIPPSSSQPASIFTRPDTRPGLQTPSTDDRPPASDFGGPAPGSAATLPTPAAILAGPSVPNLPAALDDFSRDELALLLDALNAVLLSRKSQNVQTRLALGADQSQGTQQGTLGRLREATQARADAVQALKQHQVAQWTGRVAGFVGSAVAVLQAQLGVEHGDEGATALLALAQATAMTATAELAAQMRAEGLSAPEALPMDVLFGPGLAAQIGQMSLTPDQAAQLQSVATTLAYLIMQPGLSGATIEQAAELGGLAPDVAAAWTLGTALADLQTTLVAMTALILGLPSVPPPVAAPGPAPGDAQGSDDASGPPSPASSLSPEAQAALERLARVVGPSVTRALQFADAARQAAEQAADLAQQAQSNADRTQQQALQAVRLARTVALQVLRDSQLVQALVLTELADERDRAGTSAQQVALAVQSTDQVRAEQTAMPALDERGVEQEQRLLEQQEAWRKLALVLDQARAALPQLLTAGADLRTPAPRTRLHV